jgi:hypothetical protein
MNCSMTERAERSVSFSVARIDDLRKRNKTVISCHAFSQLESTMTHQPMPEGQWL